MICAFTGSISNFVSSVCVCPAWLHENRIDAKATGKTDFIFSVLFGVSKVQQIVPILNAVYHDKSSFKMILQLSTTGKG
jgi:hypothetical protein